MYTCMCFTSLLARSRLHGAESSSHHDKSLGISDPVLQEPYSQNHPEDSLTGQNRQRYLGFRGLIYLVT